MQRACESVKKNTVGVECDEKLQSPRRNTDVFHVGGERVSAKRLSVHFPPCVCVDGIACMCTCVYARACDQYQCIYSIFQYKQTMR